MKLYERLGNYKSILLESSCLIVVQLEYEKIGSFLFIGELIDFSHASSVSTVRLNNCFHLSY